MSKLNVKFAEVMFEEGEKTYTFLTEMKSLQSGELVVVNTAFGVKVAKFKRYIDAFPFAYARKAQWIIQKVDATKMESLAIINVSAILRKSAEDAKRQALIREAQDLEMRLLSVQSQIKELD